MTNNTSIILRFILIFLDKFFCTREGNLSNILLNFISSHTNTVICNSKSFCILIGNNLNSWLNTVIFSLANAAKALIFLNSITSVCNNFSKENILIRIKPFFNYRKNIFRAYFNLSFFLHYKNLLWRNCRIFYVDLNRQYHIELWCCLLFI